MIPHLLELGALVFGGAGLIRSRGESPEAWGVVLLAAALLYPLVHA